MLLPSTATSLSTALPSSRPSCSRPLPEQDISEPTRLPFLLSPAYAHPIRLVFTTPTVSATGSQTSVRIKAEDMSAMVTGLTPIHRSDQAENQSDQSWTAVADEAPTWVPIAEAARRLGLSRDGVLKRIRRG